MEAIETLDARAQMCDEVRRITIWYLARRPNLKRRAIAVCGGFDDMLQSVVERFLRQGIGAVGQYALATVVTKTIVHVIWSGVRRSNGPTRMPRTGPPKSLSHDVEAPDTTLTVDDRIDVETMLASLPQQRREILDRVYWRNEQYRDIGSALGCSYQWIQQMVQKSLRDIRQRAFEEHLPAGEYLSASFPAGTSVRIDDDERAFKRFADGREEPMRAHRDWIVEFLVAGDWKQKRVGQNGSEKADGQRATTCRNDVSDAADALGPP